MPNRTIPNHTRIIALALATLLTTGLACGDSSGTEPSASVEDRFYEVVAQKESDVAEIDREAVDDLRQANTAAAFRFYKKLRGQESNLVFSPLSFSRVFAGYYSDDHPEADAFAALFGYGPEMGDPASWPDLTHLATNRDEFDDVDLEKRSKFQTRDIYWVDRALRGGNANHAFFDVVHETELSTRPEESRKLINDWVEKESGGMLTEFLPKGIIDTKTEAVATNLVYFLGAWSIEFSESAIEFAGSNGTSELSAFSGSAEMLAASDEEVTIVGIPYAHGYTHWVIMPHSDFEDFAGSLDEVRYAELRASATTFDVSLQMPEFEVNSKPDMVDAITELRIETQTEGGTLSGAFRETYLHQAAMKVTREGTRAAAVSAVIEYANNVPEPAPSLDVTIDKPFVHLIVDDKSGSILFLGEYAGPE